MISLLGSTGSVGRQTLETAGFLGLRVAALSADRNITLLEEQVRRYRPSVAAVSDEAACRDFRVRMRDLDVKVLSGAEGLAEAACVPGVNTVVVAVVGMAGLLPTMAALGLGRRVALANKETLVCAGELVMKRAGECGAEIIPVDSEHSAIFQCLKTGLSDIGEGPGRNKALNAAGAGATDIVKRLILTASGGPFRGMGSDALRHVTPAMALDHPTWKMGKKITVDSATLMNKGFEVIEAVHLFSVPPEKISVAVHPESVIHSMVEFCDNSVIAQLAVPDMRLPIQFALTYPVRTASPVNELDFTRLSGLTFEAPDVEAFPCLGLAFNALRARGTAGSVLNGANEAAVELFLEGKLGFYGIADSVRDALEAIDNIENPSCGDVIQAGEAAKRFVFERI